MSKKEKFQCKKRFPDEVIIEVGRECDLNCSKCDVYKTLQKKYTFPIIECGITEMYSPPFEFLLSIDFSSIADKLANAGTAYESNWFEDFDKKKEKKKE